MDLQADHLGTIVQNAIAPAFLLGAVAMQMRVLNNRLSRIVDRKRWLDWRPQEELSDPARATEYRHETDVLLRRRRAIYRAILSCGLCGLLMCCVITAMFLEDAFDAGAGMNTLIAGLFVAAMASLVLSYLFFLDEIFLSIRKLKLTIRGSRQLPH
ncbi:DUF2721 domain-containing protein [Lacisediminimonas profundi]|uniref:DUF2721 domain-containing protein n=1 Tax=Lacisediminimonas profundi TaxID=2603856 RepID=UPI001386945E|nr:DUF2721 domain-containing protein [Lacisediminimonas profundi]